MSRGKLLFKAVRRLNLNLVKRLILRSANVNFRSRKNNTPLFVAVKKRNLEIVTELINADALLEPPCGLWGISPIVVAVRNGDLDILKKLVEANDFDDQTLSNESLTESGSTRPLHVAVETGNLEMVRFLLENGASLEGDYNMNTPLHIAVKNQDISIVNELLKCTKVINELNALGETPLHTAVSCRLLSVVVQSNPTEFHPLEILRILILKGAKVTAKSNSPLSVAINMYENDPLCTQSLIKYSMFVYSNKSSWLSITNFDQYYDYSEALLEHCMLRYVDEFVLKTIETVRTESFYDDVMSYVEECDMEIAKMKTYLVNEWLSLFELAMDCTVNNNEHVFSEIDMHNVLAALSWCQFPIYWNLISSVLTDRNHLELKLKEYNMFTTSSERSIDVTLNHYCFVEIVKHLSVSDLVNLTVVLFEFHEYTSRQNISN